MNLHPYLLGAHGIREIITKPFQEVIWHIVGPSLTDAGENAIIYGDDLSMMIFELNTHIVHLVSNFIPDAPNFYQEIQMLDIALSPHAMQITIPVVLEPELIPLSLVDPSLIARLRRICNNFDFHPPLLPPLN